jgi:hypothetical protein
MKKPVSGQASIVARGSRCVLSPSVRDGDDGNAFGRGHSPGSDVWRRGVSRPAASHPDDLPDTGSMRVASPADC